MSCLLASPKIIRLATLAFAFGRSLEGYLWHDIGIPSQELEGIADRMAALNARAYNSRYYGMNIAPQSGQTRFQANATYRIRKESFYSPDHFEWAKALAFVIYQCAEDGAKDDPLFAEMEAAESNFLIGLAKYNPAYTEISWGE